MKIRIKNKSCQQVVDEVAVVIAGADLLYVNRESIVSTKTVFMTQQIVLGCLSQRRRQDCHGYITVLIYKMSDIT